MVDESLPARRNVASSFQAIHNSDGEDKFGRPLEMEVRFDVGNVEILTNTYSKFGFQLISFPVL